MDPPWQLRLLLSLTRKIPDLPRASGLSNRIVKPLWSRFDQQSYILPVWEGVRMRLNPTEAVGGYLAFIPQLYDRWEREQISKYLRPGQTFVDLGANIGAYTLWAATHLRDTGRVIAFEAEPDNFAKLQENIQLNGRTNVTAIHAGVSDRSEQLTLHLNPGSNAGGHTFLANIHPTNTRTVQVSCDALSVLLRNNGVEKTDFFKLDIEGFEPRVLRKFFEDEPVGSPLRPRYLLTELFEGSRDLLTLLPAAGYRLVAQRGLNALFEQNKSS